MVRKIAIIGPESTGKSTLSQQLATHFSGLACPEFAREYLEKSGGNYDYDDLLVIAGEQVKLENAALEKADKENIPYLFFDTDMYVMKVWCEYVFDKTHPYILDQAAERSYDLYLLCKPDIPWVADKLREYPDQERRTELFHMYRDILVNQSTPWEEISGDHQHRFKTAVNAIEQHFPA